eukprot:TRINITY_DN3076_c0_g1_i6.p1 TRINITY_DN3076_c0_g1~~TRINITY_DN3076_c0_g1_i6.p1  ORF type:complete len:139 (-),score=28.23 TRINITY_DN3076_c0_g1_i6:114-530(-)
MSDQDTLVTWEDQSMINQFGRENNRLHELKNELKQKQVELEDLQEAESEVLLIEDDNVKYVFYKTTNIILYVLHRFLIGECFVSVTSEVAGDYISQKTQLLIQEVDKYKEEIASCNKTLAELKIKLYTKFKNSINLEE